jgi:hypothetical protein
MPETEGCELQPLVRAERLLRKFYNPKRRHLTKAGDLTEFARLILGLWNIGTIDADELAGTIFVPLPNGNPESNAKRFRSLQNKIEDFLYAVYESRHPVTEFVLDFNLPRGAGGFMPEGRHVHCPICRRSITVVPCLTCTPIDHVDTQIIGIGGLSQEHKQWGTPFKRPTFTTESRPGSAEKIEVMAARVALGQSPFHEDDRGLG